jgi:hypothetical protein
MWVLNMEKFLQAAEKVKEADYGQLEEAKSRVIRLLMGDEDFLREQTLDSLADIINNDAQLVFDEYDRNIITSRQLGELKPAPYRNRRRLL